jgi:hypothetical protein
MEKFDRVEWTDRITFVCHGSRIGIRVNAPSLLKRIKEYLPPGWKVSSSHTVDTLYSIYTAADGNSFKLSRCDPLYARHVRIAQTVELDELLEMLETNLHSSVALCARRRIFVHAGVVGWRGRALVIPGRSMSGKTTLVVELVRIGATYYSDEFAVFDAHGCVHPYARPLMVREEAKTRQKRYLVETLGGSAGTRTLPVGLIVATAFKTGAEWRPRVLTPGQALLALMDNTVLARLRPETALKFLQPVALGATVFKGSRGEACQVAEWLLNEMEKSMPALTGNGRVVLWKPP